MASDSSNGRPVGSNDDFSRFKDGDHEAYRTYYSQYSREIYYFLSKNTDNRQDAEDLTADTFAQLYKKRSTIESRQLLRPFLFTVAKHLAFNLRKRQQVRTVHDVKLPLDDPEYIDTQFMTSNLINYLFKFLTPAQYDVMTLYSQGFSTKEIAQRLGDAEQNIRNHKTRAIIRLKKLFGGKGFLFILLLLQSQSSDNHHLTNLFSTGVHNISKKDLN